MKKLDLGKGKIIGLFLHYAIPSVISMLVISSYIVIDGIFIGNGVGKQGLAAVNIAMPFLFLINSAVGMFTIGGSVVVAIKLGNSKPKEASKIFSFIISIICGFLIVVSILGLIFINPIVSALGASATLAPLVKRYIRIFLILSLIYNLCYPFDIFVKVDGKPKYSMVFNIVGCSINIILDYLFVMKFNMGLTGAALASCLGAGVSTIGLMIHFFTRNGELHFTKPKGDMKIVRQVIYNGGSEFFTQVSTSITTLLFNYVLLKRIGEIGVSAMSIVLYVNTIVIMVMFGISEAIQPIVSYNLGADQPKRVMKTFKIAMFTSEAVGIIAFIIMGAACKPIILAFTKNDLELTNLTVDITQIYILCYLVIGINIVVSGFFTALGKAKESIIISLSRSLIVLSISIVILPMIIGNTGIWLSPLIAELVTVIIAVILLNKNKIISIKSLTKQKSTPLGQNKI